MTSECHMPFCSLESRIKGGFQKCEPLISLCSFDLSVKWGEGSCACHRHTDTFEVPLWCSAEPCKMASELKRTCKYINKMREL